MPSIPREHISPFQIGFSGQAFVDRKLAAMMYDIKMRDDKFAAAAQTRHALGWAKRPYIGERYALCNVDAHPDWNGGAIALTDDPADVDCPDCRRALWWFTSPSSPAGDLPIPKTARNIAAVAR